MCDTGRQTFLGIYVRWVPMQMTGARAHPRRTRPGYEPYNIMLPAPAAPHHLQGGRIVPCRTPPTPDIYTRDAASLTHRNVRCHAYGCILHCDAGRVLASCTVKPLQCFANRKCIAVYNIYCITKFCCFLEGKRSNVTGSEIGVGWDIHIDIYAKTK